MLIKDGPGLDPETHTLYDWLALSHFMSGLHHVQEGVSFTIALLFAALAIRVFPFQSGVGTYVVHRTSFIVSGAVSSTALFAHPLGKVNAIIALRVLTSTLVLSLI